MRTVGDLLEHVPFRHDDYRSASRLVDMKPGEEATVIVTIDRVRMRPTRRRNLVIVEAVVHDESGTGVVVWFNQRYLAKNLKAEMRLSSVASGAPRSTLRSSPKATSWSATTPRRFTPRGWYRCTPQVRRCRHGDCAHWSPSSCTMPATDPMRCPPTLLSARNLPLRRDALVACHQPRTMVEHAWGRRRLAYDELLLLQRGLVRHRRAVEQRVHAPALELGGDLIDRYLEGLPFALTGAQQRATPEIDSDLQRTTPMRRLLQGDVGSGKTAVAVYALLRAVDAGRQGALMAPTETLATQHLVNVTDICADLGVRVVGLTNGMPAPERRAALQLIESGEPVMVVGTHALIQDAVVFGGLAVAVVDEQHRFGVEQRAALERKADAGIAPHVLHMTATPIPRTLAMTVFGDLDVTVLDELPPGRTPVITRLVPPERRREVFARMRRLLSEGRQAYVVCPLVDASPRTSRPPPPRARRSSCVPASCPTTASGCIHGQLPIPERRALMEQFRQGEIDVLVATTVIEVGVDVPNATVMVVERADMFGLAQLHQLRGRVGRGSLESFCILVADPTTDDARARLDAMVRTTDGFVLAEVDLELRGEGTVLAARQSGLPDLRHARLRRHRRLAAAARRRRHFDARS